MNDIFPVFYQAWKSFDIIFDIAKKMALWTILLDSLRFTEIFCHMSSRYDETLQVLLMTPYSKPAQIEANLMLEKIVAVIMGKVGTVA